MNAAPKEQRQLILASASRHRAAMLSGAGIEFRVEAAKLDERAVEEPLARSGATPADIAEVLANAKAADVASRHPTALVIGCDQTLELDGTILHKPATMEDARRRLLALSGKAHMLHSAVCLVKGEETLWRHVDTTIVRVRPLDPGFVARHLARAGEGVLGSVGAYQIEGLGAQLLESVEGDFFSVVGLPLLPLLARLREMKWIDA
jgi:septum formation protein